MPKGYFDDEEVDEGVLDMRYDNSDEIFADIASASDIINNSSTFELSQIFKRFGEERYASVLAEKIVEMRKGVILGSPTDLKNVINAAFP